EDARGSAALPNRGLPGCSCGLCACGGLVDDQHSPDKSRGVGVRLGPDCSRFAVLFLLPVPATSPLKPDASFTWWAQSSLHRCPTRGKSSLGGHKVRCTGAPPVGSDVLPGHGRDGHDTRSISGPACRIGHSPQISRPRECLLRYNPQSESQTQSWEDPGGVDIIAVLEASGTEFS